MMDLVILSAGTLVILLAVAVTARREYVAAADNPFGRAPRSLRWRDRVPSMLLIAWLVAPYLGVSLDLPFEWQAPAMVGGVLVLLAVCLLGEWTRRPAAGARVALLRPRGVRDLTPRLLAVVSAIGVLVAVGGLAWLAIAGITPGSSPCDVLDQDPRWPASPPAAAEAPKTLSSTAALAVIAVLAVCVAASAGLTLVAARRAAVGDDAEIDGELRRRAVVRAVAAVGSAAGGVILIVGVAVQDRYPAGFDWCSSQTFDAAGKPAGMRTVSEPSVLVELGWSAVMLFAIGVLAFGFYRFAAPSQGWRDAAPRGAERAG